MAVILEGRQFYCTTMERHFGPVFASHDEAQAFLDWCHNVLGKDPRDYGEDELDMLKDVWFRVRDLERLNAQMLGALESVKESDNESYIDVGPHDNPRQEYRCSFCGCGPHDDHDEACPIPVVGASIEAARKAMPAGRTSWTC